MKLGLAMMTVGGFMLTSMLVVAAPNTWHAIGNAVYGWGLVIGIAGLVLLMISWVES